MTENQQNQDFYKFWDLLRTSFNNKQEEFISKLLKSLQSSCLQNSNLFIPFGDNVEDVKNKKEFLCWLLSTLLSNEESIEVLEANVDLQINMFQLLACRSLRLFCDILDVYVNIGNDFIDYLFTNDHTEKNYFEKLVTPSVEQRAAIKLSPQKISDPDRVLEIIVKIFGELSYQITLQHSNCLHKVWMLTGRCIEGGDTVLKSSALKTVHSLMGYFNLPNNIQVQSYIIDIIKCCLLTVCRGEFGDSSDEVNRLVKNVCLVVSDLKKVCIIPDLHGDVFTSLTEFYQNFENFHSIPDPLLKEVFKLTQNMIHTQSDSVTSSTLKIFYHKALSQSIHLLQVIESPLKELVGADLNEAIPHRTQPIGRKRRHSQMEEDVTVFRLPTASPWWAKVQTCLERILSQMTVDLDKKQLSNNLTALCSMLSIGSNVASTFNDNTTCIHIFSKEEVQFITTFIVDLLTKTCPEECAVELCLQIVFQFSYLSSIPNASIPGECLQEQGHIWAAVGSMPWLAGEVSWLDLQCVPTKKLAEASFQKAVVSGRSAKTNCVQILAVLPKKYAPNWRCHVLRTVAAESNDNLTTAVIKWLPMIVHTLGSSVHPLVVEFIGLALSKNEDCLVQLCQSLNVLVCALQGCSIINDKHLKVLDEQCLECRICNGDAEATSGTSNQLDLSLLQKIFALISNTSQKVVLSFLKSLPNMLRHCTITGPMFDMILDLLSSQQTKIIQQLAIIFSQILHTKANEWFDRLFSRLESLVKGENSSQDCMAKDQMSVIRLFEPLIRNKRTDFCEAILKLLMRLLVSSCADVSCHAHLLVSDMSFSLGIHPKEIYIKYRKICTKVLVETLRSNDVKMVMKHLTEVFHWEESIKSYKEKNVCGSFVSSQIRFLLPPLIVRCTKENVPSLLQELASCMDIRLRDMVIDHFQYILSYLVMHCSIQEKEATLNFISSTTGISIDDIRRCSVQSQVNELVLGIYHHKKAVLKEILLLKNLECATKPPKSGKVNAQKNVVEFLKQRLLGILVFLDFKLSSSSTDNSEKNNVILSLSELLSVMGPMYISSVARKVLSSLKSFSKLTNPEFQESSCKAWISFLSHLDDHSIENMIEEVLLIINPLAKKFPREFAPVLKKILLETESIAPMLPCLPCLPQCEEFSQINEEIKSHQTYRNGISSKNIEITLQIILKGMSHESINVRCYNLKKLKRIMKENVQLFHDLILNTDRVAPIIENINKALLVQCKENEKDLHNIVAECIGLLGAIDPVRLCMSNGQDDERNKLHLTLESAEFVYDLVMGLSRAFLSAGDTSIQTCASYAMQEILLIYGVNSPTESNATTLGSQVWNRFSVHIRKIVQPLHTSKYRVNTNNPQIAPSAVPSPIYGTKFSKTFHHWLTNWSCSLIDLLTTEKPVKVFTACKPIMRRDTAIAMFLLPYIVICALTESETNHASIMTEILAVIGGKCSSDRVSGVRMNTEVPQELSQLAVQTVFTVLDHVNRYAQKQKDEESSQRRSNVAFTASPPLQKLFDFMDQIPDDTLAEISFQNQAYSRALSQLEAHITKNPQNLQNNRMFLQKIYVALDEPDGVTGVAAAWEEEPSLQEQIIHYESTGRLHDALSCYEKLCVEDACEGNYQRMLQCYLNLDQPHSVLNITKGLISRKPDLQPTLTEYHIEAAWRLGQWDLLDDYFSSEQTLSSSWGVSVGEVLFAAIKKDSERYSRALERLRASQILPISAASMEGSAYQRAYPYVLRLHILAELEEMVSGLLDLPFNESNSGRFANIHIDNGEVPDVAVISPVSLTDITKRWSKKLDLVQTSSRFLEPVLSFRRTLLRLACDWTADTDRVLHNELKKQLEQTWLQTAKVARNAGHMQQGERAFISSGHSREVFLERAKWYWIKGEQHQAVATLKKGITKFFPNMELLKGNNSPETAEDRFSCAKAKLILAQYTEQSATLDINVITLLYRDVTEINKSWEDGQFQLALYYDRIIKSRNEESPPEWVKHRVLGYVKSLNYGSKYVYHSMPRLLSLWLDFGTKVSEMQKHPNRYKKELTSYISQLSSLNSYICELSDRLAPYMFLTALPQLISRICHSHSDVFSVLSKLIANILCTFPQQSMWHLIAVSKSSYNRRAGRCLEIFERAKEKKSRLVKFITDTTKLADLLIELSNKNLDKGIDCVQMSTILRSLPRLLSQKDFSNILLPLQHLMQVHLPHQSKGSFDNSVMHNHNPFPSNQVYISSVEERVEIMPSLQQPKRIMIRGSDGKLYSMMCKPKDDLRKDCRLMDFNLFVNRLLMRDPDTRKKNLHIRTYAVVPLNEECGLIEWVPNLNGLRPILYKIYKDKGCAMSGREMKNLLVKKDAPLATKKDIFLNKLMPKHPPVLGSWFLKTFYDPQSWLAARLSYCRTTALMSMVGYILGLGDRHGENILLDSSSGDCVHVDYNCLFNKGETFDWPERVPFRLTHNMVAAMGPTAIEGFYRKACEATLRVMRQEREALMSVLQPFIYDPLVEWTRADPAAKTTGEVFNEKAQSHVNDIEKRLSGQVRVSKQPNQISFPLSVEGQVNYVIQEATNIDNLCQMYIGWAPFM